MRRRRTGQSTWQAVAVVDKQELKSWVLEAVDALGPCTVLAASKWVWENHEAELTGAGDLFFTWQYDIRWAAQMLRTEGTLAPVARGAGSVWRRP